MQKNNTVLTDNIRKLIGAEKIDAIIASIYFRLASVLTEKDLPALSITKSGHAH